MQKMQGSAHLEPIFVTGTGTDIGKTYVTALLCRALNEWLQHNQASSSLAAVRYYKAAISGADSIASSDAGYVIEQGGLTQEYATATTYLYEEAVSPHLAYCNELKAGKSPQVPNLAQVLSDFQAVYDSCQLTVLEGSGGIYCPLWSNPDQLMATLSSPVLPYQDRGRSVLVRTALSDCFTICDLMHEIQARCGLKLIVVANAKLGCINEVLTTLQSLKHDGFDLSKAALILNHYDDGSLMQRNNIGMLEALTKVPVIATIKAGQEHLELRAAVKSFFSVSSLAASLRAELFTVNQGLEWWPK